MLTVRYLVTLEGRDEQVPVVADQRDFAATEMADIPDTALYTRARYMAWSAMRRTKLVAVDWAKFNSELCVNVESDDDDEAEPDPKAARGRPARLTATSSKPRGSRNSP